MVLIHNGLKDNKYFIDPSVEFFGAKGYFLVYQTSLKNMRILGIAIFQFVFLTFSLIGGELPSKEAFNDKFPKRFVFRGEYQKKPNMDYESFFRATAFSGGVIQKFVPYDEMVKLHPTKTAEFAVKYARENPGKLVLLHWDAQEHVNTIPESAGKYFPGHWYTFEGSVLREAIDADDEWIRVEDWRSLTRKTKNAKAYTEWRTPILLLLELDKQGKARWDCFEYVELVELDKERGAIRVKRGQALSNPRNFEKGSRIAGIAAYLSRPYLFALNYSSSSPRDKNGKQAADVQFDEVVDLFDRETGLLRELDGSAFDVLNWRAPHDRDLLDSDGDGKADGAYDPITGEDLWLKGAYAFQKKLRMHFGKDFILMNDGYAKKDQRAVGIFDGIESEGLVYHNDAFRGFSKTLNIFGYWEKNNPTKYRMATIVPKLKNPDDAKHAEQYTRLCIATATCLGAAVNTGPVLDAGAVFEEIRGGDMNKIYWLGKPLGPMHNMGMDGRDLLDGAGIRMDRNFTKEWLGVNCDLKVNGNTLLVSARRGTPRAGNCILKVSGVEIPRGTEDVTIIFEVQSAPRALGSQIPRIISVSAQGLPRYERNPKSNKMYGEMWGLFGEKGYTRLSFYYRKVSGRKLDFLIEVEGGHDFSIRNFRVNASPSLLYREFENGVVLVNPSLNWHTFRLHELFGEQTFSRLKGRRFPNDGSRVGNSIEIGPLDGVFLKKTKTSQGR